MANIGEALTARQVRERLEAIKKFIPVRDSVREKLQARQEAKVEFTEGAEELFKPITAATETVKTAISGKPDPDKPQPSLLQAIEQLRKDQSKPIKGFNYKTDFIDGIDTQIRALPTNTSEKVKEFGEGAAAAAAAYHSRETFLKNPDQEVNKQRFLDGLYKINKNIERLDRRDVFYKKYMGGVNEYEFKIKQEELPMRKSSTPTKTSKKKTSAFKPQLAISGHSREDPGEHIPTAGPSTAEEEDDKWEDTQEEEDDPKDLFPGTLQEKIGPAKYFANSALKDFTDYDKLVDVGVKGYGDRNNYLRGDVYSGVINPDDWLSSIYFASKNQLSDKRKAEYKQFVRDVNERKKQLQSSGKGFLSEPKTGYGFIACPSNIVDDESRLEVLNGGKRAGNNSLEIINEADICQRLFQRGIMDINIYRGLIDELTDGYYSDY